MKTVTGVVEWCLWHSLFVWKIVWCVLRNHWPAVLLVLIGAVGGVITRPLWSIAGRLIGAVFGFVFKWLTLLRPSAEHRWKAFEAIWATPMVVLEARGEHKDGLGRLLYKWLDAYHALWCVFLPDVLELGGESTVKYWRGSRAECRRSVDRACCVGRGFWAFLTLATYAVFYTVIYVYDLAEKVWWWSCVLATTGVASHATRRRQECVHLRDVEELQQAERLSEAFWRGDGCVGKPKPVRTLSGLRAEQRVLRAKMKADKEEEDARRERRVSVGEDVPSGNCGHRLRYGRGRPPAACQSARGLLLEDQLFEDQLTEQSSDFTRISWRRAICVDEES
ncbi:hypothetical protein PHYSODRAFT_338497 [Phytophthora sojae]|uniref:Uncharacterized protein n=1 Tax=Phytophthora sojae (strain P6497) TaxID=1094619 RepID=G5A508_PHYSP|nr:hypothetical protein PHYSODRAFT_338497 [Phytophthora sojae]EGZ09757.1 hypothetical protein PHYSODRAFT_338497 [Phytophthora sojae]|eukprot:XP_009534618.1 hypothetical protein PHYSODRAFT_338497 [Phytophthora sojae]